MRASLLALSFACIPMMATAQSIHTITLINDTRSQIVSFWIAPTGSHAWIKVDFTHLPFEYGDAYDIALEDSLGCQRDFRTLLSDGRNILASDFDICRLHAYRPQVPFWHGRAGTGVLP
jgi:hypothetical protein